MISLKRFFAVFKARNIEFFRDKSSLGWNLVFPVILLIGFSIIFSGDGRAVYKVGVFELTQVNSAFINTRYIDFISYSKREGSTIDKAKEKLAHHSIDFLVDFDSQTYWVNDGAPNSYLVEQIFLGKHHNFTRLSIEGDEIRYIDWVFPGILGMNMMFSCLYGVGYVIVRYRKNSVLKRLKATPLSALEFVLAQLLSRLFIVMFTAVILYTGCNFIFDFFMLGQYFDLFVVGSLGAFCLITLGLLVASRSKSEELVGGLLNLTTWPMMILSGVWFSLEGAPEPLKIFADFFPLTHLVSAARKVIIEGATLSEVSYHLIVLSVMSLVFLALGSYLFNWNTER